MKKKIIMFVCTFLVLSGGVFLIYHFQQAVVWNQGEQTFSYLYWNSGEKDYLPLRVLEVRILKQTYVGIFIGAVICFMLLGELAERYGWKTLYFVLCGWLMTGSLVMDKGDGIWIAYSSQIRECLIEPFRNHVYIDSFSYIMARYVDALVWLSVFGCSIFIAEKVASVYKRRKSKTANK